MKKLNVANELKKSKVVEEAVAKINKEYEIPDAFKPDSVPKIPEDVTMLSAELVSRYYSSYEAEVAWIDSKIAVLDVRVDFARHIIDVYRKKLFLNASRAENATIARAMVDTDENVVAAEDDYLKLKSEKTILESRREIFMKYAASMSRDLTRRKMELDYNPRDGGEESKDSRARAKNPRMTYKGKGGKR